MTKILLRRSLVFLLLAGVIVDPATAAWTLGGPGAQIGKPATGAASKSVGMPLEGEFLTAQGGCSGAASQAAAQTGGQVLSVQTAQRGGRTVCIVTVLIPGRDGSRPRRQTITIPQ